VKQYKGSRVGTVRVLVVSAFVGRSPLEVSYNFVYDEISCLSKREVRFTLLGLSQRVRGCAMGVLFHDLGRARGGWASCLWLVGRYPVMSVMRGPVGMRHNNAMLYVAMAFLGLPRLRRIFSSIGIDYLSLVMGILQGQVQRLDVSLTVLRTPPCLGNTHC